MPKQSQLKLNRLFIVAGVLGGLFLVLGGAYAYRAHRVTVAFRKLRAQGLEADARGDRVKAVDLLGQYLARDPNDLPALIAYSKDRPLVPSADGQNLVQAIQSLRYALRLDPALAEQQRELMGLYVRTGYATEAMACADALLAGNPHDAEALSTRTTSLVRLHRLSEALAASAAWTDADPASVTAKLTRLELLHSTQHSKDQAVALAQSWAKQNASASDGTPDLLRGHALLIFGDNAGATGFLESAAAAAVAHVPAPDAGQALAVDLDVTHQPDAAFALVRALSNAHPADVDLRLNLARRDWDAQQFSGVVDLIGGIADRSSVPSSMLGLEAISMVNLNHTADVGPLRREVSTRPGQTSAAWDVVIAQTASGRFDSAAVVNAARPAVDLHEDPFLRYYLGEAYSRLGERDLAARQWQRVVVTELGWADPAIRLCQVLNEQGRPDDSLAAGVEAVRRAPRSVEALIALASAWTSTVQAGHNQNANACLQLVERLAHQLPADGRLPPLHAALLTVMNRPADAAAVIQTAIDGSQPYPASTWEHLAEVSESAGLNLQAACLAREQRDHGLTPTLAYAKAAARFAAAQPGDGLRSYDADRASAQAAQPQTPADALAWSLGRARYLDLIRDPSALAAWQALGDANRTSLQVQQSAVAATCVRSDRDTLGAAVDRLGTLAGKQNTTYELARARWLLTFGSSAAQVDEVRGLLDPVLRDDPDSLDAHLLSARAYELAGKPLDAIADLRAAVVKLPNVAALRLTLARLLMGEGDLDGARDQLAHLNPDQLSGDEDRRQAAVLLAQNGQVDRGIALLEQQNQAGTASVTTRLTLANLYLRHNEPTKADAIARQLLDTHPDVVVVQFESYLLAGMGKTDQAMAVLDRLSDPRTAGTGQGVAELTRGDFALRFQSGDAAAQAKALALFAAATTAGPTNPATWRGRLGAELMTGHADDALSTASAGLQSLPGDPALLAVGRHAKAILYADPQPELRPMLLSLLSDPADTAAPATVLEALADADASQQPLPILATKLRELSEQFPQFQPLRMRLIALDQQLGQPDQAAADIAQAVQAMPADEDLIRLQADVLAKSGRWSEVLAVASRWHDRFPSDALAADLAKADALLHLNQPADARVTLQPYADHPGGADSVKVLPLLARAGLAEGQADPASIMDPLLTQGPAGRTAYMQFAVGSLQPDDADAWIRRAIAAMPPGGPDERLVASDLYLRLADLNPGDLAARFITESLDVLRPYLENVGSPAPAVLLAAATRQERLAHPDVAADLYRRVLAISPGQIVAANNLAMILARGDHADQAVPLIDAAVKSTPGLSDLYDTRAFVLSRVGRPDDALAAIGEALRLDPSRVSFHVRQITLLADDHRTRDAQNALHALDSVQYDPSTLAPATLKQLQDLRDRFAKSSASTRGVM